MLRACRRVLRPGGRIAYAVVHVSEGLTYSELERALDVGPPEVASRRPPARALEKAGFVDVLEEDVTPEYRAHYGRMVAARRRFEAELRAEEGDDAYEEELSKRARVAEAIADGLLRRSLLRGVRP